MRNNFDFLRLFFAISVMIFHTGCLLNIPLLKLFPNEIAVQSFFVISGYLIFASYEKSKSIRDYFLKRIRRLVPAAYFLIFLSVILGIFLSNTKYFGIGLLKYIFANLIFFNSLMPTLPGVFVGQPEHSYVNGSLWTLKVEIFFYILVPITAFIFRKKILIGLIVSFILSSLFKFICIEYNDIISNFFPYIIYNFVFNYNFSPFVLMSFFLCGGILYYLKNELYILHNKIFFLIVIILSIILYYQIIHWFFKPIILSFIIIYFAIYCPVKIKIPDKFGDLSYGIYIYHFPIIQTLIFLQIKNVFLNELTESLKREIEVFLIFKVTASNS